MNSRKRDALQRYRTPLVGLIIVLTLIALLAPGSKPWTNKARWRDPGPGLQFGGISQLLSEQPIVSKTGEMTVELWLVPGFNPGEGNQEIVSLYERGVVKRPLLLGQFPRGFLLYGRADNPGGDPRADEYIGIDEVGLDDSNSLRHLALTIKNDGTTFFVNGRPTPMRLEKTAARAGESFGGHLLLCSSNTGWRVWLGGLLGVAVHERALSASELRAHTVDAQAAQRPDLARDPSVLALYRFEEGVGRRTRSAVARGPDLVIPELMTHPTRGKFLSTHALGARDFSLLHFDVVSNVLGFMPLGFLLSWKRGGRGVVIALAVGTLLSLGAELAQTQIVGRASSLIDLACNAVGVLFGGALGASVGALAKKGASSR